MPPMFSCIRLRKWPQCGKPKIRGETQVTNKLSSESSKDKIQYRTMCERSIMWHCSQKLLSSSFEMGMESFWNAQSWWTFPLFEAWGTWNQVEIYDTKTSQEGSTYVEGGNRKRKNRKRRNINCRMKGNWIKRKRSKEKDYGKGSREIGCLIEGHPCLVAFVYESDNNVVSQRLVEKLLLPTSFHPNQARIKFSTR